MACEMMISPPLAHVYTTPNALPPHHPRLIPMEMIKKLLGSHRQEEEASRMKWKIIRINDGENWQFCHPHMQLRSSCDFTFWFRIQSAIWFKSLKCNEKFLMQIGLRFNLNFHDDVDEWLRKAFSVVIPPRKLLETIFARNPGMAFTRWRYGTCREKAAAQITSENVIWTFPNGLAEATLDWISSMRLPMNSCRNQSDSVSPPNQLSFFSAFFTRNKHFTLLRCELSECVVT